jgi:hypothetical protein
VAFLVTLIAGLFKIGALPASNQEFYGQVFASLELEDLPESQTFRIPGEIPHREFDDELPASVRRQLSEENGEIVFKGWIRPNQIDDLKEYNTKLEWLCTVEKLAKEAQPPDVLKGKIDYLSDHEVLALKGPLTEPQRKALLDMDGNEAWNSAVAELLDLSHRQAAVTVEPPPNFEIPQSLKQKTLSTDEQNAGVDPGMTLADYDEESKTLIFNGAMSTGQRDLLLNQFPVALPLTEEERKDLREEIESRGEPLNDKQAEALNKVLEGLWTVEQLMDAIDAGGAFEPPEKTACQLLEERAQQGGISEEEEEGEDAKLSDAQKEALQPPLTPAPPSRLANEINQRLEAAGPLTAGQKSAVEPFLLSQPTLGERNEAIYFALLKTGPVSPEQKAFLLAGIQAQAAWQKQIVELFHQAHQIKYSWSGDYREQGTVFWWLYEYLFKPLTATMFALLAFYVASAAFRAFRAKNVEATLLLGTAFIILLGRTFAGVLLTAWMPEALSGLRIENLAVYIMQVFNTAGNRAIMIGIALGIASTSLKVLLGIDRSYLGSQED